LVGVAGQAPASVGGIGQQHPGPAGHARVVGRIGGDAGQPVRARVLGTLGGLAADDEHHARLRDTLLTFLQTGGSYKTTAERLVLHKNTVQYRIRRAEESPGRPVGENQHDVELALRASHWLGSSVLRPTRERSSTPHGSALR
jgi:PucR-like helix-turn-helix protein